MGTLRRPAGIAWATAWGPLLHVTGMAAYALADESSHWLLLRHGYTAIGPSRLLPDRLPVWAMWRPPSPADVH